jgi:hypothetical protein
MMEWTWPLAATALLLPFVPATFESDPDLSWQVVLHDAFARHLHFGTDVIYTLGPFGFAFTGYGPRTYVWTLAVWLLIAAATIAGAAALLPRTLLLIPFALLLCVGYTNDATCLILALLLARTSRAQSPPAIRHLLAIALAVAGLMKFSFFIAAAGALFFIAIGDLRRRRWPATLLTFAASTTAFWLLAQQPLANLPAFLRTSFGVAGGYGDAMALSFGWPSDLWFTVAFAAVAAAFLLLLLITDRDLASTAAAGAVLFVAFRAGFMRQDAHDLIAATALAAIVSIVFLESWPRSSARLRSAWCLVLIASGALISYDVEARTGSGFVERLAAVARARVADAVSMARHGTANLDRRNERLMSSLRAQLTSRPPGHSFDAYFSSTGVITAWNLPASRRPAFQACCSTTEELFARNAAHLRAVRAPETLLIAMQPLDKRLPSMEDSLSWPEFLRRYELDGQNGAFVVLRRRIVPAELRASMTGDLVFAHINLRYTAFGVLAKFFFRTPAIYIRVTPDRGPARRFRMLPAAARAGFLLSPLVVTNSDFEQLFDARGRATLPHVRSIMIDPEPFARYFEPAQITLVPMTLVNVPDAALRSRGLPSPSPR